MKLPTIATPKYSVTVPSTNKTVEFRPFLVKEEKILMIAQESKSESAMIKAIRDIIRDCTFNKVNEKNMTNFDMEYIFLKLRAKSVGETTNIGIKCEACEASNSVEVNLDDIAITTTKDIPKKIMLTDTVGVVPRHILAKEMDKIAGTKSQADVFIQVIIASLESIFDENEVYPIADTPYKDVEEFLNGLSRNQIEKIEKWIDMAPKIEHDIKFKCKKCGADNVQSIKGAQSFF